MSKRVLFVCVHNSDRSQMAEAFFNLKGVFMTRNTFLVMALIILLAASAAACSGGGSTEDVSSVPVTPGQDASPAATEQAASPATTEQAASPATPGQDASPTTLDLASISLKDCLSSGKFTLAEFGWKDCIPCKQMKPILEELALEYEGVFNVVIVEVYSQESLTRAHKIMAIPTQIIFNDKGVEVYRHIGYFSKKDILAKLKSLGGI